MTVIGIDGKALPSALSTSEKDHHPERVMKRRQQLSGVLHDLQVGWNKDRGEDPLGATQPNEPAIDRHYDERWREQCRVAMNAQEAVECDPEAMANWMMAQREEQAKQERWITPLHKLHGLDEFEFKLVGLHDGGELWLSTHCAVLIFKNGQVRVFFLDRDDWANPHRWDGVLHGISDNMQVICLVDAIDYTPKELFTLLGAIRADKITHPTEEQMSRARGER
jgi:hypothetical protein